MGGTRYGTVRQRLQRVLGRGQSEILSVVILVGIVVILATLAGALVLGNFGGGDEQLLANVQGNVTLQGITIDHEGGDTFDPEDIEVLLQGDTEADLRLDQAFETDDGAGTFAPGDRWTHTQNSTLYGGEFRLLVIHEPTNSVLLDQPYSIPITGVSLLVENWRGERQSDTASVFSDGSEYNFTVQVNARDGQPAQTVPLNTASGLTATNGDGPLNVTVTVSDNEYKMVTVQDADGETGTIAASWNGSADGNLGTPYEEVALEAEVDDQFSSGTPLRDSNDTTTVRVLRNKSVFTVAFAGGYPAVTDEGRITAGYNLENVGAAPDDVNVTVTYTNDTTGTVLENCTVRTQEIDPGESVFRADEGCAFDNTNGEYGDINVTVSVPGDNDTAVRTLDPPNLTVDITDAPSRVSTGGSISVDANITNVGGVVAVDQTVELDADGYNPPTDTAKVDIAPGESTLLEGLGIDAPTSATTATVNVSTPRNYDTETVDVQNVLIPIQSEADWDLLSGSFERTLPTTAVYYSETSSVDSTDSPGAPDGSGQFEFETTTDASGAVVWEDLPGGENWLRFEYNTTDLAPGEAELNVSVDGTTRFSTTRTTGNDWEHRLIDIAGVGNGTRFGLGVDTSTNTASGCFGSNCTLYYDNVTYVDHSLPLQTKSDWERTAGTFDGPGSASFGVDTTSATNGSASGQFDIAGTGTVAVREQLSEREYLTFDNKLVSGSLDSLEILANGTVVKTVNSVSGSWVQERVFLDGYGGNTRIAFRAACSGGCALNLDNVTLSPPSASIPITTEQDWTNASSSFETSDDAGAMAFEVNGTVANVSGASGRFTASEFSEGIARVSVTENLTLEDAFSFDYRGSDLGIAQVFARVTVGGTTEWTSNGDPGGWTTEQVDVSNYSGQTEIAFEMGVSTETLNREELFFDNVTWTDLPNNCKIDKPSYDSNPKPEYRLTDGTLSRCALAADGNKGGGSGIDFLTSSNGFSDPQWFDPPEDNVYPDRGGQISYSVKAESGTDAHFYFGGDNPSTEWYNVTWSPGNEELTVSSSTSKSDTNAGGSDGTDEYYRIIVDWDLNDAMADSVYARAVNGSGATVAYAYIQDDSFSGGSGQSGHIGFGVGGNGEAVWDELEYGETNFEETLPAPGDSYYANGFEVTGNSPDGLTHSDGWIHDRLPVEEGETRTYSYYVDYDSAMNVSLRDGPSTGTQSFSDIENEIHTFSDGFDYGGVFRSGREVMVSLTIDYTDPTAVQMRAKAVTSDGFTRTLNQTWSGAGSHGDIYVSTYEWDGGGPPPGESLRLITRRTGQYAAGGFPLDDWVHGPTVRGNRAGFDHLGDWVDRNDPIRPGGIVTIPYFASDQSAPTSQLSVQLRDEQGSDQHRGPTAGPSQAFEETLGSFMSVNQDGTTILVVDYTVPGEVFLRAVSLDTGTIVGERVVSIPDSAPDSLPVYLSTYEETANAGLGSIRYSPF